MTGGETFDPTEGGDRSGALRPAAEAAPLVLLGGRLAAIDFLRGIVMVLMVLDHTREFIGDPQVDPTDLAKTTASLFLTRWVTHFWRSSSCWPGRVPISPVRWGKSRRLAL